MISANKYGKSGYKWKLKNYNEDFYLDENNRWVTLGGSYISSSENQMLTYLLYASISKKPLRRRRQRLPVLESIIKNILENRQIQLNGIHKLSGGNSRKLKEL